MQASFSAVGEFLRAHQSFTILSHIRPDGDAYGSTLGLGLCLRAMGKSVTLYNEDGLTSRFTYLPGCETVAATPAVAPSRETQIIAVDTAEMSRLGKTFMGWRRTPDLNIDHHVSNPLYGQLNVVVSDSPATAEVLYEIMRANDLPITPEVAANLFIGLSTDTGSFRYRSTTTRSFEVAAALSAAGADPATLAQHAYLSYPASRFRLLRLLLQTTEFLAEDRVCSCTLTPAMYAEAGSCTDDTEGLIEYMLMTESVEVAVMFEEMASGGVRVSLRSRGRIDVQKIASLFGGGGHKAAAGIRTSLPFDSFRSELLDKIVAAVRQ
ncbi:bifunctional oligoribonuclease/PAP phosphatase NrnA [Verrucomicrobia bacterium LW23]|nr:bifunctional oligoribonuclease/PAP phosphatase NrnA [Verrucomicrobia bacterium LW23]